MIVDATSGQNTAKHLINVVAPTILRRTFECLTK
ncbi:hypothetical protein FHW16_002857 [Phyllobacterium myrsinacearum]|uniref:Uncharacterized protein n=1 Tax=Phyllobacterium myrsinacearum TaxID=28101 RepID=A0A839EK05_9HYPH|nr:hypothetical protein [Phyllobacterium myrsinacearum]